MYHSHSITVVLKQLILLIILVISVSSCNTESPVLKNSVQARQIAASGDANGFLIVDCLLPGKVHKLGRSVIYLTPRRPVKTSVSDCEIRGGEYVAYDRSNYATALNIWLSEAKNGDAKAQNYVGEIYEKGLGTPPNYEKAVQWYKKAAAQGYPSAKMNLGFLYEKGLGVKQDLKMAVKLFRQAAGLPELDFSKLSSDDHKELQSLRAKAKSLQEQLHQTQQQLINTQALFQQRHGDLQELQKQLRQTQQQLANTQVKLGSKRQDVKQIQQALTQHQYGSTAEQKRLMLELQQREAEFKAQRELIARLERKNQQQQRELKKLKTQAEKAKAQSLKLASINKEAMRLRVQLEQTQKKLTKIRKRGLIIRQEPPNSSQSAKTNELPLGTYHALIIGNNQYRYLPRLKTAVNDAKAVDELLRQRYGYKTKVLLNATRYQILEALNQLRKRLTETDNLLIYYGGHGELDQVNQRGHWLPVDATEDSTTNWISNIALSDILNTMSSKHILVVVDSCYSGTMTRSSLARLEAGMTATKRLQWIKKMLEKQSRTALTSGGLKPVLDSGGGVNSIFAKAFLETLEKNTAIMEAYKLYRQVSALVNDAAAERRFDQVPEYAPIRYTKHEAGEFFFVPIGAKTKIATLEK